MELGRARRWENTRQSGDTLPTRSAETEQCSRRCQRKATISVTAECPDGVSSHAVCRPAGVADGGSRRGGATERREPWREEAGRGGEERRGRSAAGGVTGEGCRREVAGRCRKQRHRLASVHRVTDAAGPTAGIRGRHLPRRCRSDMMAGGGEGSQRPAAAPENDTRSLSRAGIRVGRYRSKAAHRSF